MDCQAELAAYQRSLGSFEIEGGAFLKTVMGFTFLAHGISSQDNGSRYHTARGRCDVAREGLFAKSLQ
jgi:hypothetical protein